MIRPTFSQATRRIATPCTRHFERPCPISITCTNSVSRQFQPFSYILSNRAFHSTPTAASSSPPPKTDWSATQYLKFGNERTRPVYDLLSQVLPHIQTPNPRIYDLGCGPGNSTSALLNAFPGAHVTGMDSSPDMLAKARTTLPSVEFVQGDLATYEAPGADLLFSNAVFHWLRRKERMSTLVRLFEGLKPGGVLAIQVPDNYHAHSHRLMRRTARMGGSEGSPAKEHKPWTDDFKDANIGQTSKNDRPDLDPIQPPEQFYDALVPFAGNVNIWRTEYMHVLEDAGAIVEWVKGTGLQPYLQRIGDEGVKKAFLEEYEKKLGNAYPKLADGKVLLGYPRLFVVAVRK